MHENTPESLAYTKEEIESLTDFHTAIEIAESALEGSELQSWALNQAFELATTVMQVQSVADAAPDGSTQKTRAASKAILLAVSI
ncbi:MAG: hypothetical protein PHO48_01855 [Candidatus Gracilibacteria bacterium]|jgi:hypothetical protein|nr:hypothetical protein [Candidatus Gracilibacteria bacterium]MDD5178893.1 hypothetical protein [Candidatus Gracilibacteria bacterium]